jgi:hypothetical protein
MGPDITLAIDDDRLALTPAEAGLSVLLEACERAVEEVGVESEPAGGVGVGVVGGGGGEQVV